FSHRRLRIAPVSQVVASWIPKAAGIAYASRVRGDGAVTLCTFGDGSTSKGDFHEALNFAAVHRLPVVFVCENNGYAISVPLRLPVGGGGGAHPRGAGPGGQRRRRLGRAPAGAGRRGPGPPPLRLKGVGSGRGTAAPGGREVVSDPWGGRRSGARAPSARPASA